MVLIFGTSSVLGPICFHEILVYKFSPAGWFFLAGGLHFVRIFGPSFWYHFGASFWKGTTRARRGVEVAILRFMQEWCLGLQFRGYVQQKKGEDIGQLGYIAKVREYRPIGEYS